VDDIVADYGRQVDVLDSGRTDLHIVWGNAKATLMEVRGSGSLVFGTCRPIKFPDVAVVLFRGVVVVRIGMRCGRDNDTVRSCRDPNRQMAEIPRLLL